MANEPASTDTTQTDATTPAAQDPTPPEQGNEPKGGKPDFEQAYSRTKAERDEWKTKFEELEGKLGKSPKPEDLEAIKTTAAKERAELEAKHAEALLGAQVDLALISAGCRDTAAAKAHVDFSKLSLKNDKVEGLDVQDLAKNYAYLFQPTKPKDAGAAPAGTPDKSDALYAKMRSSAGLSDKD